MHPGGISWRRQRAGGCAGRNQSPFTTTGHQTQREHPHLCENTFRHPHCLDARGQCPQAPPKPRQHRAPAPGAAQHSSQRVGDPSPPQAEQCHTVPQCRTCILVFTTSKGVLPKTLAAPARAPNTPVTKGLITLLGSSPGKEERLRAERWCGDEAQHPQGSLRARSQVRLLMVRAGAVLSRGDRAFGGHRPTAPAPQSPHSTGEFRMRVEVMLEHWDSSTPQTSPPPPGFHLPPS